MLGKLLRIIIILPLSIYADNSLNILPNVTKVIQKKFQNITFKNYLQKFDPSYVWGKIDKKNKLSGINKTVGEEFDAMLNGIDETDELLGLEVRNGDPKIVLQKDGRRWDAGNFGDSHFNRYNLKQRFIELTKQAIYQTRYKMVIMQTLRDKYRKNSVYKMGFLMSKTDTACKNFAKFAYRAFKDCSGSRQTAFKKFPVIEILISEERLLNLWFDVDLLVDLVIKNDENCRRMLNEAMTNRKHAWKFYD